MENLFPDLARINENFKTQTAINFDTKEKKQYDYTLAFQRRFSPDFKKARGGMFNHLHRTVV